MGSGGPRLLGLSLAGLHTCGHGVHPVSFVGTGLTGLWNRSDQLCLGRGVEVVKCSLFHFHSSSGLKGCKTCNLCKLVYG